MGVRIGVGLGRFPFESIRAFRSWLDTCEDGAIDSIWQSDQLNASDLSPEPLSLLAMIAGATMSVQGTSSRGTLTTDTYSLSGITAALNAIARECAG